jgi:hypothetical protein
MSFTARFDLPTFEDDIDTTNCINCPHADGNCFNAGRCLMEDYE